MALDFRYIVTGIFKSEIKNRFRSIVLVGNKEEICYVESSSRLDNYLTLRNRVVLLDACKGKKLKYKVLAIRNKNDYILLCPMMANKIIASELNRRFFSFLGRRSDFKCEFLLKDYKCDIFIPNSKTIIEIKSVLTEKNNAIFPAVSSERSIKQLDLLDKLQDEGYSVVYIFLSLNPYTNKVFLDPNCLFYSKLHKNMEKGMKVVAFSITCNETIRIKKSIDVIDY